MKLNLKFKFTINTSYFLWFRFWHIAILLTKAQVDADGFQVYFKVITVALRNIVLG